jgi:hypothetical protein
LVELVEEEEKEIVCGAKDGYPQMDFKWNSYRTVKRKSQARTARMLEDLEEKLGNDSVNDFLTNNTRQVNE